MLTTMIHDFHAHCIPRSFRAWLERSGADHGADLLDSGRGTCVRFARTYTTGALRDDLGDVPARVEAMDRMGVDVQVMGGWIDLTAYQLGVTDGRAYSRAHNDCLAEESLAMGSRSQALATVPLQDPDGAVDELSRAMSELGMVGAQIATTVADKWLHQLDLSPFWEAAEDLGALVLLHPMAPLTGVDLGDYLMSNSVGRPAETTIALTGLIMSGVFERHPALRVCAVHGGGFTPFQVGRLNRSYEAKPAIAARAISRPPGEYLRQLYVDTVVHEPAALRFLVDLLGAERILLGTDYPFEMGDADPLGLIAAAELEDEQQEMILSGNATRLLGTASAQA